ncbi:MAG: PKD domain-containing protein [Bacteroidetes bacterium]|nr:MAG: PKD domain-containing protein [Bacteroidota bacterium]
MIKRTILFILTCGYIVSAKSQCPNSIFSVPASNCAGQNINFSNFSTGAISYTWDFCAGDFDSLVTDTNEVPGYVATPSAITPVVDGSDHYAFGCSRTDDKIIRYYFGNSFDNPPVQIDDLGNIFGQTSGPNGIAFHKEGNVWYAIVLGIFTNTMSKIEFANGLGNAPTSGSLITSTGLNLPRGIDLVIDDSGNIIVAVANFNNNAVSVYNFGNSINNTPVLAGTYNVSGTGVIDVALANDCGTWMAYVSCFSNSEIRELNFGNSLLNAPVSERFLHGGVPNPIGISIVNENDNWYLISVGFSSSFMMIQNLGQSLPGSSPILQGNVPMGAGNPMCLNLYKEQSSWFAFVMFDTNNMMKKINFRNSCQASKPTSSDSLPNGVSFSLEGIYKVSLEATSATGLTDRSSQLITVVSNPVAGFSFSGNCLGDQTAFMDTTLVGSGSIASWNWDFGDTGISTDQNPVHTYADTGTYSVQLFVLSAAGCSDSITSSVIISPLPTSLFSTVPGCSSTDMPFNDLSSISSGNISSWYWDFGNGDTSTLQNPVYLYPAGGAFTVSQIVISDMACSDTSSQNIVINDRPEAIFMASNTCVGQSVQFTDLSTVVNTTITDYLWDFGDTGNSMNQHPNHTYSGGVATYSVQLIVTAANGCIDTLMQDVKINNVPSASFTFNPSVACVNNDVYFQDLSTVSGDTISAWSWDFGDGNSSELFNPTHRFSTPGNKTVTLIAYSPTSCPSAPVQQSFNVVGSPVAAFTFTDACLGQSNQFTDLSSTPPGDTIQAYSWRFGVNDSTTLQHPSHTFANAGSFPVILSVITVNGCTDSDTNYVPVYQPPVSNFAFYNACSSQDTEFENLSTADSISAIIAYNWNFGDPASGANNSSILTDPLHTFSLPGTYLVSLISTSTYGCRDTITRTVQVRISSPVTFSYNAACAGDSVSFINAGSASDSTYFWDFGDGTFSFQKQPAHIYPNAGFYQAKLTVTAFGGCRSSDSVLLFVNPLPVASFVQDPACVNTSFQFTDNSTVSNGNIVYYEWRVNNILIDTIVNPVTVFPDTGLYAINLFVRSDAGCEDDYNGTIRSYPPPTSSFTFNPQFGSPPLDVQFTDLSINGNTYVWDFGDGTGGSTDQAPLYMYQDTGLFTITQIVTSPQGCRDTSTKKIYVIRPVLDIAITGDSSYLSGNYFHVVTRIANLGTREISEVNLEARLEDGSIVREKLTSLLPNGTGGIQWYTFHASFFVSPGSRFSYYCIKASDPNGETDDVPENNEKCFSRSSGLVTINPYPNPFTDQLTLRLIIPFQDFLNVDLLDQTGKLVKELFKGTTSKGLLEIKLNIEELSEGLYYIRTNFRDDKSLRQIVKSSIPR